MAAKNSVGLIELGSIAAGFQVVDAMLKESDVTLVLARTICSGKYMVMIRGDVGAVEAAVAAGKALAGYSIIDTFLIPNLHESIFPAISGITKVDRLEALGVIESFSVASLIEGADAMAKAANVQIVKQIQIGGGYATTIVRGDVGSVRAAVEAGAAQATQVGELIASHIIARPSEGLVAAFLG